MIDPAHVPSVTADETLARFVLYSGHVRGDKTVKPDALVPHPHQALSATRHLNATEAELWSAGQTVAGKRGRNLCGRADLTVAICVMQKLLVKAAPVEDNPNHADVSGWPADKPAQKAIALELAAVAKYIPFAG